MTFRPMLWPTLVGVIALAILISLGNWQMDRLAWKEGLLAKIEAGLSAEPGPLPASESWQDLDPVSLRYTPAEAVGRFVHEAEVHVYISSIEGEPGYHVITPLELSAGGWLLVDRGFVPIRRKEASTRMQGQVEGEVAVAGILISPDDANAFTPEPDLIKNVWYHRPIDRIAELAGLSPVFPLMLDADSTENPGGLPVGGQTRLELKNPHLGYAMTWFGLAATLLAIWLAFHIARGRIRLRP